MKLAGRYNPDATRGFIGKRDGSDQILARHGNDLRQRQRCRNRRTAHMDDRFVVRVVVFQRLWKRPVRKRSKSDSDAIARSQDSARTWRTSLQRSCSHGTAERRLHARERKTDDIHHAKASRSDDVFG